MVVLPFPDSLPTFEYSPSRGESPLCQQSDHLKLQRGTAQADEGKVQFCTNNHTHNHGYTALGSDGLGPRGRAGPAGYRRLLGLTWDAARAPGARRASEQQADLVEFGAGQNEICGKGLKLLRMGHMHMPMRTIINRVCRYRPLS